MKVYRSHTCLSSSDGEEHRTRLRKGKRKLDGNDKHDVHSSSKLTKQVWKGRDSPHENNHDPTDTVEWRTGTYQSSDKTRNRNKKHHQDYPPIRHAQWSTSMPDKHILELVLDTLQRRDTNEIFAEPVKKEEVEDYHKIIEEPMDFGTMRAKLHEGFYKNLHEFEHDVFLIPENAMYFNASSTVYYRQARAIHDLAKNVFHVLKTDPENFVSEFSGTRRRSMRKALSDKKDVSSSRDAFSKGSVKYSSPSPSAVRRSSKKNPIQHHQFYSGGTLLSTPREAADSTSRRETYRGSSSELNCKEINESNSLFLVNGDISILSYKDSLLSFAKDLGPTAQMVANRKLRSLHQESNGYSRKLIDLNIEDGEQSGANNAIDIKQIHSEREEKEVKSSSMWCHNNKGLNIVDKGMNQKRQNGETNNNKNSRFSGILNNLRLRNADADDDKNVKKRRRVPVILALENSHSNTIHVADQVKASNKKNNTTTTNVTVSSNFAFDIPFLKERLKLMSKRP